MIKIKNVSKKFSNKTVLDNVECSFNNGEINVIIGENGVGKTTLLNIIVGNLIQDAGEVYIDEFSRSNIQAKREIYYISDEKENFDNLTGLEYLAFILKLYKNIEFKVENHVPLLDTLSLTSFLGGYIGSYSLGMKQKLQIAAAILSDANNIIMDEPFNSLDSGTGEIFEKILSNLVLSGKCIVLTCHDLDRVARITKEVYLLTSQKGIDRIAFKTVRDLENMIRNREQDNV